MCVCVCVCVCVYAHVGHCLLQIIVGTLSYNAQSPDEAALVSAARNFGYVFKVLYVYMCAWKHIYVQYNPNADRDYTNLL